MQHELKYQEKNCLQELVPIRKSESIFSTNNEL